MDKYEGEFAFDEPVVYSKESSELLIYPVLMKDYLLYQMISNILLVKKNTIPDVKIIKMSYLDFIFYMMENEEEPIENRTFYRSAFYHIVRICMRVEDFQYLKDDNGRMRILINDIEYDGNDFDEIKNIIIKQNNPDDDSDVYIDPKVEEVLEEARRFMNRNQKKMGSLEDQMICVLISTSLSMDDIKKLTIRKFVKILQRVDHKLHYEIYKSASLSGMVEFKSGLDHWMSEIKNDKYAGLIMDSGELDDRMKHVT